MDNSLSAIKHNQNGLYCADIKCKSIHHRNGIDKLCKCIIDSCLDAGKATIPHTRTNDKTMPGWSDRAKYEREDALDLVRVGLIEVLYMLL